VHLVGRARVDRNRIRVRHRGVARLHADGAAHLPPEVGYSPDRRFIPPSQIEEIVATMQIMGYGDDDLRLPLGGNLMRLVRTVWKPLSHRRSR
jgi:hypothetical protein